jgi:hypothetical protein
MAHHFIFKISMGFRIDDATCARILAQGLSSTVYTDPIYIDRIQNTDTNTIITVHALSKTSARNFKEAILTDLGSVESFEPPPPTGTEDPPEGTLDVWSRVGQWSKIAGNATTTISGLPSQPKGIIVWGSGLADATVGTFSAGGGVVFGFSNGTDNRDLAYVAQDAQVTSNAYRSISKKAFHLVDPTGNVSTHIKGDATITFGSTSFTMNWSATTLATVGNYFVFGGDDIGSVVIQDYEVGTTASAVVDYSISSINNPYNFAMMLYPHVAGGLPWPTSPTGYSGALSSISVQAGPDPVRSWSTSIRDKSAVNPSDACALQRNTYLLTGMSEDDVHEQQYCRFNKWTNTGFSLEWFNAPTATNYIFSGMFVQGGHWDAGIFYQPTAPGVVYTLFKSKYPLIQGLMAFSANKPEISDEDEGHHHAYLSIGGADNQLNEGCSVYGGIMMSSPTSEKSLVANDKFMKYIGSPFEEEEEEHTH